MLQSFICLIGAQNINNTSFSQALNAVVAFADEERQLVEVGSCKHDRL